jgi:hypothetical protein
VVRFTLDTWDLATHRIDPHVDDTREYLVQDLFRSRLVMRVGYVRGRQTATLASPRTNLTGDPHIADGLRAVLVFSRKPVSDSEMQALDRECQAVKSLGSNSRQTQGCKSEAIGR